MSKKISFMDSVNLLTYIITFINFSLMMTLIKITNILLNFCEGVDENRIWCTFYLQTKNFFVICTVLSLMKKTTKKLLLFFFSDILQTNIL